VTRRILAGFLAVLAAVIAAVIVPLGLTITAQQTRDFRTAAKDAALAVRAVAEEHFDDNSGMGGLRTVLSRFAAAGDKTLVLDAAGRVVIGSGAPIQPDVITAAKSGAALPSPSGTVVIDEPVRDGARVLGRVVLVRGTGALEERHTTLWLALVVAALGALLVGATVAWSIARWIGRPLTSLAGAAKGVGAGNIAARADATVGPPQVRDVAIAFNNMATRVASLLDAQRAMTAEVSHQLRTPLAALRLRLELLRPELEGESAGEVEGMLDETNRLGRLLDGLLAVARAEALPPTPTPTNLHEVAAERLGSWQPVAGEQEVRLELDAGDARVLVTPGHLEQVLDNLLDNAIRATPARGRIMVGVRAGQKYSTLTVCDSGPGMTDEQRARALRRYVTDRGGTGGTGLGLAVVNRLVEMDSGTLELHATPGGGLTAVVTLPSVTERGIEKGGSVSRA
jgi:signal transduction histidine kinase